MKARHYLLCIAILVLSLVFAHLIHKQKQDYILPAPKEQVEQVINDYYKNVKIRPKAVKQEDVDINDSTIIDTIANYIKKQEGFSPTAYKDHTQYTIGYGTATTDPDEVIDEEEAEKRLYAHIRSTIIPAFEHVNFQSIDQLYSAIDFSYNLGHNCFLQKIVRPDGYLDCKKMLAYNKMRDSDGNLVYSEWLAKRRFENYLDCAAYEIVEN